MNTQFFAREDRPADGPPRELVGYGPNPPVVRWPGDARVAVQIVVNYEEGSEKTFPMGDETNDILHEIPFALDGYRDSRWSRSMSTARGLASGASFASSAARAFA